MGKSFTLDPISHRRLTNMGEEDRYYISITKSQLFLKNFEMKCKMNLKDVL